MNHIASEDQRDPQAGFRHRYFLDFVDKLGKDPLLAIIAGRRTVGHQTGPDLAKAHLVILIRTEVEPLIQLPGFFLKGHPAQ